MRVLVILMAAVVSTSVFASDVPLPPVRPKEFKQIEKPSANTNCVKKDKNGKCPPLPNSPRPTPKKIEPKVKTS